MVGGGTVAGNATARALRRRRREEKRKKGDEEVVGERREKEKEERGCLPGHWLSSAPEMDSKAISPICITDHVGKLQRLF